MKLFGILKPSRQKTDRIFMNIQTNLRSTWPAYLFCVLLLTAFFPNIFFKGEIFIAPMSDLHLTSYSFIHYFQSMASRGLFPLWNPYSVGGVPYGADLISGLNFYNLLALLVRDINQVWNLGLLINVIGAFTFTLLYLRQIGLSTFAATVGAVIFAFTPDSGCCVDSFGFILPLVLWLIEKYSVERAKGYLVAIILSFSLLFLSTLPQYSLYAGVFFVIYAGYRLRSLLGVWLVLISLGLVSFHLARMLEFLGQSSRGQLWFINVLLPIHLAHFLFPFLFESPFRPETNFFFSKIFYELTRHLFHTNQIQYIQAPYIGVLGFTCALFTWSQKGIPRFYRNAVLVILFYMMTFPILSPIYKHIPVLAQLPRIVRLNTVFTFCLAVLAGTGSTQLVNREANLKLVTRFYIGLCILLLGTLVTLRYGIEWQHTNLQQFFKSYIEHHMAHNPDYTAPLSFYLQRIEEFFAFIRQWTDLSGPSVTLSFFFIAACLLVFYLWNKAKISKWVFYIACLFLLSTDLLVYFRMTQFYSASAQSLRPVSSAIRFLQSDRDLFRIVTVMDDAGVGEARERVLLSPDSNLLYGLQSVEGYMPLIPARFAAFFRSFQRDPDKDPAMILGGPEGNFDFQIMDFLNVKYFITSKRKKLIKPLELVAEDEKIRVYRNDSYFPRAFLVHESRVIGDQHKILEYLKSPKMSFNKGVVLEENPLETKDSALRPGESEKVTVKEYTPHKIQLQVNAAQEGFLVLTDIYYPGWKALRDGQPAKIFRANYAFRAVEIPQGSHIVEFLYRPASFQWGMLVSLLMLIGALAFCFFPRAFGIRKETV